MVPEADVHGLLGAVISATLLIGFLVYRGRVRTGVRPAYIRAPNRRVEPELFASVFVDPPRVSARGLLASGALHAGLVGFASLTPYLFTADPNADARRYTVRVMEFRMPSALVYTPPLHKTSRTKPARARTPRPGSAAKGGEVAQAQAGPARTQLQLPAAPLPAAARSRDVILQPDAPPDLIPAGAFPLPSAFLWSQQPAPPELSRLVGSLQEAMLRPFTLPTATPGIRPPNREVAIADLQAAQTPLAALRPKVTILPANVSPVAVTPRAPSPSPALPTAPLPAGAPLNLVAIMRNPAPRAGAYLLELGNRTPILASAGAAESTGAGGEDRRHLSTSDHSAGPQPGVEIRSPADVLRTGEPGADADPDAAPPDPDPAASLRREEAAAARRQLGVVIVQESGHDGGLEGGEILSGRPVYTVYLDVPGSPARWVMQYCLPASQSRSFEAPSEGVIRILPRSRVEPPYPVQKVSLQTVTPARRIKRLVLYAMVNERGEVENIKLVRGAGDLVDQAAVAALRRWSFRPAVQGDGPVSVEALFGIPME